MATKSTTFESDFNLSNPNYRFTINPNLSPLAIIAQIIVKDQKLNQSFSNDVISLANHILRSVEYRVSHTSDLPVHSGFRSKIVSILFPLKKPIDVFEFVHTLSPLQILFAILLKSRHLGLSYFPKRQHHT